MSHTCHHHNVYHDHSPTARLTAAKERCAMRGVRFTPLREEVFSLILSADKPLSAYELIDALKDSRTQNQHDTNKTNSDKIAPPTVYRSLDFLLKEGLIHQLNSINAYVPCCHPRDHHAAAFLICRHCHAVEECSTLPVDAMMQFAKDDAGFAVEHTAIELVGVCRDCQ